MHRVYPKQKRHELSKTEKRIISEITAANAGQPQPESVVLEMIAKFEKLTNRNVSIVTFRNFGNIPIPAGCADSKKTASELAKIDAFDIAEKETGITYDWPDRPKDAYPNDPSPEYIEKRLAIIRAVRDQEKIDQGYWHNREEDSFPKKIYRTGITRGRITVESEIFKAFIDRDAHTKGVTLSTNHDANEWTRTKISAAIGRRAPNERYSRDN